MNRFDGSERDWTEQYAVIGEFVVEFEKICHHLRFGAGSLLQTLGLKEWKISEIIFHSKIFTAAPLFSCYASMVAEHFKSDHILTREINDFRKEFEELCEFRNNLLHATFFMGNDVVEITDNESPTEFSSHKRTPNKNGSRFKEVATNLDDVRQRSKKATIFKEKISKFNTNVLIDLNNNLIQEETK